MSIPAPIILLPSNGADYATDIQVQTLSGTTSSNTSRMLVNGNTLGVSYVAGETAWAWTGTLSVGANAMQIVAYEKDTGIPSLPATITITYLQAENFITVSSPTGVRLRSYQDKIEVVNVKNPEPQTVGYNYYISTESGGVNRQYVRINSAPVAQYSFFEDQARTLSTGVDRAGNIKVTTVTEEVTRVYYYSFFFTQDIFNALVAAGYLPAVAFTEDTSFFFVATALIYDPAVGQVTESAYSSELEGTILTITTGIRDLPARTQDDIILTYSQELLIGNPNVDTKPGTVLRDTINPISEQQARDYIVQDFLSRANSVGALQDFDDANGDGVSDPVSTSTKKQALQLALNLTDPNDVQQVIDDQFDKLASNVNVIRRGASPATGQVTFYVTNPPIRDMNVFQGALVIAPGDLDQGIPAQQYQTISAATLSYANKDSFYNKQNSRYELVMDVQAVVAGSAGNTDSYTINTAASGVDSDFRVENPNPISYGTDKETNHDLATRTELAMFVDTGTWGGYMRVAIGVPGVRHADVEKAGDELMIRDYDSVRNEHIGGKVDIYVQGERTAQVYDNLAFSYESVGTAEGTQIGEIFPVLSAAAFQFKCINPRVTVHTPIFQVSRVYNSTRGGDYDISGYQIIGDGNVIDLDETKPTNVSIGLASFDTIRVDYKFRSSDTFVLNHQPVLSIVSVVGQISGPLTTDNYDLVKMQDPLAEGGSTIAKDGIRIKFANNLPLTGFQTITDELHVIILGVDEALKNVGVDPESIVVQSVDHTVTYVLNVDYSMKPGTDQAQTTIRMIETGRMASGQQILISYTAIENFTITYTTNSLLAAVQAQVDKMKHACADVIVKQAIENSVDFNITVVPKTGVTDQYSLMSEIHTEVANYVGQLDVGSALTQSEVVHIVQGINDVDYVVLPFTRMVKADGSFIIRDDIGKTVFKLYNQGVVNAYVTVNPVLTYKTVDQGGPTDQFRGIFEDGQPLVLQSSPLDVSGAPGRGYIQADGTLVVSTKDGQLPDTKSWQAAFYVYGETGSKDINVASLEYLTVGSFVIYVDDPRTKTVQTF